jgi:hypothetical protein
MISHHGSELPFLAKPWVSNFIQTRPPNERVLPRSSHHSRDSAPKPVGASSGVSCTIRDGASRKKKGSRYEDER